MGPYSHWSVFSKNIDLGLQTNALIMDYNTNCTQVHFTEHALIDH